MTFFGAVAIGFPPFSSRRAGIPQDWQFLYAGRFSAVLRTIMIAIVAAMGRNIIAIMSGWIEANNNRGNSGAQQSRTGRAPRN